MQKLKPEDKLKIIKEDIEYEFEVAEKGGYLVTVPELPGCLSEGHTFEKAWEMIQDAMEGWLHLAQEHGDPIPVKFNSLIADSSQGKDG